jgi:ferredoxin-NADP reductase/MOSC domain-containing protein YiiM
MPRLVSVNVGMPRDVEWQGRTVHTGIWKSPVAGPRRVRRLNIDGDGQGDLAGHGGEQRAVYVYQLDSYRYWAEQLDRDDFGYGQFGENFTVSGLADDEVCIGDRYRVGEALLEVTQPRVTCYRVGIRMNEPRMPALLTGSGRPGFYLRVIEEGDVEAGLLIHKVADGPERMSVAEVSALLYRSPHPRAALQRALRIPALSPGWRGSFQALLDGDGGQGNPGLVPSAGPPPAWAGFHAARVVARRRESTTVWTFVFEVEPAGRPIGLPGQFVTLRLRAPNGAAVLRSYSLSGPAEAGRWQVSVKREELGVGSRLLTDSIHVGDHVELAAPRGGFLLAPSDRAVALVSAGIGVTPVLAMLESLVAASDSRPVWWLHGARNGREHPFAARARTLLSTLPDGHRHIRYSRPEADDRVGFDYDAAGRLTAEVVDKEGVPRDADYYLCGPAEFLSEMQAGLVTFGVLPSRIHVELFVAAPAQRPGVVPTPRRAPHPPDGPAATGPLVSFARSGVSAAHGPGYASLLELAEACDVPVRWSCRTGVCHSCETRLLAGDVEYAPDPLDAPGNGVVLVCCASPVDDVVLDL